MAEGSTCEISRWQILKAQLNNLSAEEFHAAISNDIADYLIIDVRTREEFEGDHIPEALHIDYLADGFWEKIESIPLDKPCYIYCRTGRRSTRVCTLMKNWGFTEVYNLGKGLVAYRAEFPSEQEV